MCVCWVGWGDWVVYVFDFEWCCEVGWVCWGYVVGDYEGFYVFGGFFFDYRVVCDEEVWGGWFVWVYDEVGVFVWDVVFFEFGVGDGLFYGEVVECGFWFYEMELMFVDYVF